MSFQRLSKAFGGFFGGLPRGFVPPANWVSVNSLSNLVAQDEDNIFLEDDKVYLPGAGISTPKRFVVGKNVTIASFNSGPTGNVWESNSSDDMFVGTDVGSFTLFNAPVRCPNGQLFNISGSDPSELNIVRMDGLTGHGADGSSLIAQKFGTFTDITTLSISTTAASLPIGGIGVNDGVTIGGTTLSILSIRELAMLSFSPTFVGLDLGAAVVSVAFEVQNLVNIGLGVGSIGIKGLIDSGNIAPGIRGTFQGCDFIGPVTPLSGVSESDLRLRFNNCAPVPNSTVAADSFLTVPETVDITAANTFFPIGGGNWDSTVSERITVDTNGLMTYVDPVPGFIRPSFKATIEKDGGGSDKLLVGILYKGGVLVDRDGETENNAPTSVSASGLVFATAGDTFQGGVANVDSAVTDVIVSKGNLDVINGF